MIEKLWAFFLLVGELHISVGETNLINRQKSRLHLLKQMFEGQ